MAAVKQSLEIPHKEDWRRYEEFLQSWKESSLNDSDWIYKRVRQKSLITCKRYKMEDAIDDVFQSSLNTLAEKHFEKGRSLDSYVSKIVTSKAINLKKRSQKEELFGVIPEPRENIINEVIRRIYSERSMRRLLLTRPALQRKIIKLIISFSDEDEFNQEPVKAQSRSEIIRRLQEEIPDISTYTARTAYESLRESLRLMATVAAAPSFKENSTPENEIALLAEIDKISSNGKRRKYDELYRKFEEGALSPEENEELIELSDQMEILDAKRLELLSKLADLRGTSLREIVQEYKDVGRLISPNPGNPGEIRAT